MPFRTYRYLEGPVFDAMRKEQEAILHTINFYAVRMKQYKIKFYSVKREQVGTYNPRDNYTRRKPNAS